MAFLDNSGDIILDAVLTDLGRKRMAEGNFKITQFALGDDEIDYSLYNKDHASGSAYYDLEILQTPIFEAFTRTNANINYGLVSLGGRPDLFYLPTLKFNDFQRSEMNNVTFSGSLINLAVVDDGRTTSTVTALNGANALGASPRSLLISDSVTSRYVLYETGISSSNGDPDRNETNRNSYLVSTGLLDSDFSVSFDKRFIASVYPMTPGSKFSYGGADSSDVKANITFARTPQGATSISTTGLNNYRTVTLPAIDNNIKKNNSNNDLNYSIINGPRGRVLAFTLGVTPEMLGGTTPANYSLYGKTAQSPFSDSRTYDYVDTIVYIQGNTTGVTAQLVVRVIRLNTA